MSGSECSLLLGNYSKSYSINDASINPNKQKEFHQYLHNWSVDNCFEFVPSPFFSNDSNTLSSFQNDDSDEKMKNDDNNFYGHNSPLFASYDPLELGHSRISSALQCVMWPNMTRNPPKPRGGGRGNGSLLGSLGTLTSRSNSTIQPQPLLSTNNISEEKEKVNENDKMEENSILDEKDQFKKNDKVKLIGLKSKQHWNGKIAEIVGSFSKSKKRWPVELMDDNQLKKALIQTKNLVLEKKGPRWKNKVKKVATKEKNETEKTKTVTKVDDDNGADQKNVTESELVVDIEDDEERDVGLENKMSNFQSLIDEMQQVRSDAKSGLLSDEERRSRAAETAMKLMSYMGLDSEDPNELLNEMNDNENENEEENE